MENIRSLIPLHKLVFENTFVKFYFLKFIIPGLVSGNLWLVRSPLHNKQISSTEQKVFLWTKAYSTIVLIAFLLVSTYIYIV